MEIPRPNYETWLKDTSATRFQDNTLVVETKSAFAAEMLERRLSSTISRAVERVAKRPTSVAFQVAAASGGRAAPATRARPIDSTSHTDKATRETPETPWISLNPKFTFEHFVVGSSNELAHAAASAVASAPGSVYNPLYVWSKVGLGKTHLLHAMAHQLTAQGLRVLYVSSERFTNEFIKAIHDGTTETFRKRYRGADALLIDDIQFIAGKEQTQEGFFHTFNELCLHSRQVVVTGDEPARKSMLEERIQSRLEGGLAVDIQQPDYEMKVAILRRKADALGVTLHTDVVELLATHRLDNVRELEGCLNRIVAHAHLTRAPLTTETVSHMLSDIFIRREWTPAPPEAVLHAVASYFGIEPQVITGRRRDKHSAVARRVTMYLLREESQLSSTRTGQFLGGKDHSTVLYAHRKMQSELTSDPNIRQDVSKIRTMLQQRSQSLLSQ